MRGRVRRVAVTGGIGTGKSYVLARIAALGVPTVDADRLAHAALEPGGPGHAAVAARFGPDVLGADGSVNRRALATLVFQDASARRDLESIVHPIVRSAIDAWFEGLDAGAQAFAVADIPLLYETGRLREFDAVIVAACDPARQLERALARPGADAADIQRRIAVQLPIADKVRIADYVVRTDGTFGDTDAQVERTVRDLRRRFPRAGGATPS